MNELIAPNDPKLRLESFAVVTEDVKLLSNTFNSMFSIMRDNEGLGLSAPQIGINKRFFVMEKISDGGVFWSNEKILINPLIVSQSDHYEWREEGCLSLPGVTVNVKRPIWVKIWYNDKDGDGIEEELHDLSARVFLHEFDHLRGVLITDYD